MTKLEKGINCYLSGDTNSAVKLLTEYANENPPDEQVCYYLGLAHNDLGKNNEAGMFFQKAIEIAPDRGIYHYHLGVVYSKLMLLQQSIEHLTKTIEKNPEHVRAQFILGNVYFKKGDLKNAVKAYENVIQISPYFAPAYYELGNSKYYMGDIDEAETAYKKALELNKNPDTLHKMALILLEKNEVKKSIAYCVKAIESGFENISLISGYLTELTVKAPEDSAKFKDILNSYFPELNEDFNLDNASGG